MRVPHVLKRIPDDRSEVGKLHGSDDRCVRDGQRGRLGLAGMCEDEGRLWS